VKRRPSWSCKLPPRERRLPLPAAIRNRLEAPFWDRRIAALRQTGQAAPPAPSPTREDHHVDR
jgi:hypothetical protein